MTVESVKVIVRCRPLNARERTLDCKEIVEIDSNHGRCSIVNPSRVKDPPKTFFFDGAFDCTSTTEQIYADIVYPLVEGVTEGYNGTIFAYGQTGCGKTFTMQGVTNDFVNKGVISRSFEHIFETTAVSSDVKYLLHASFMEIYNEDLRDLLGKDPKIKCELKEHPEKGIFVNGLSMHKVKCVEDCRIIMEQGWRNRHVGATLMNADSSRSHSIFTIYLEMVTLDVKTAMEHLRAGKLNLVDLAGSERQSKTGATGDRLKEATKINLSLSALGNVISALVDANSRHVPYRDSKLTRLLQDSLGGNTKTLMIACLSPADNNYDETLSTLRYANRAKNIKNKPVINEDPKDALLRQYQEEIVRLKSMLEKMEHDQSTSLPSKFEVRYPTDTMTDEFARERQKIKEDYERRLRDKEALYVAEATNTVKLQEEIAKLKDHYDTKIKQLEEKYMANAAVVDTQPVGGHLTVPIRSSPDFRASESEPLPFLRLDKLSTSKQASEDDVEAPWSSPLSGLLQDGGLTSRTYRLSVPTTTSELEATEEEAESEGLATIARPQFAVHLTTTSLLGFTTPLDGISREYDKLTKEELLRKLHLLEADMVGGEEANNAEVRERRSRRRRHAEERRRLLVEANATLDDDGIMLGIYESVQDELRHKIKLLQCEKQKSSSLETEIEDLQREFELDREDYLECIRKQNRQLSLLQAILDKIQPCIRKDSNYANLDKIKKQACFDEDANEWVLPALTLERTILPLSANPAATTSENFALVSRIGTGRCAMVPRVTAPFTSSGLRDPEAEKEEEARLYAKLASRSQNHTKYFANKRKEQLLLDAGSTRRTFPLADARSQQGKESFLNNSNNSLAQGSAVRPSAGGKGKHNDSFSSRKYLDF